MFTLLLWTAVLAASNLHPDHEKGRPCCHSSSSSSSSECEPCPRQIISLEDNKGAYPVYYGLPNSGFSTGQSFLLNTGPYGGFLIAWDCYCAGDKFDVSFQGGTPIDSYVQAGITDNQCSLWISDSQNCVANENFYQINFTLPASTLFNITITQQVAPYHGGSGFIAYFEYAEDFLVCGENFWDCNLREYQRTYPCDFGN